MTCVQSKLDLSNVLEDMDHEVREVYSSISESSQRDQQINIMMLDV